VPDEPDVPRGVAIRHRIGAVDHVSQQDAPRVPMVRGAVAASASRRFH
jgi:hypothetical protein